MLVTDRDQVTDGDNHLRKLSRRKRGVLVVDDMPTIREVIDFHLQNFGFDVWQAGSGGEAEEVYRRHQPQIDLILMDVRMPGTDGPNALRAIRRISDRVLCCFMTADSGDYSEADLIGFGAQQVFSKPLHIDQMLTVIEKLMCGRTVYEPLPE